MLTGWLLEMYPSDHHWRRYEVGQWLVFGWFGGWGTLDTQLARQKLGKKTHPNHGGRHCPTAAMVPSPRHRRIQQLANMLRNKSMSLKLENIIVFTTYLLAILRHNNCWRVVPECLWVASAGSTESIILSAGGTKSMMLSAGGTESMMLSVSALRASYSQHRLLRVWSSALFCCVITLC